MSDKPVKAGIVGLGRWAKVLTKASKKSKLLEIVAGYSRSEEKAGRFSTGTWSSSGCEYASDTRRSGDSRRHSYRAQRAAPADGAAR